MQTLGLGKGDLIRNLPIETRILHRQNSLMQYKLATNKNITGNQIVVMIEWIENGYWLNKSVVAQPNFEISRLSNSPIFKKNQNEAIYFCTAKGQKMLTPGLPFGQIYNKYHDIDDKMLYIRLMKENSFG